MWIRCTIEWTKTDLTELRPAGHIDGLSSPRKGDPYSRERCMWHDGSPLSRGRHSFECQSNPQSNIITAEVLVEKLHRQRQRPIRLRLGVGPAAVAGEGVVGAGIFVDRHQRIG